MTARPAPGTSSISLRDPLWVVLALVLLLLALRQTYWVPNLGLGLSPAQLLVLGLGVLYAYGFLSGTVVHRGHVISTVAVAQFVVQLASYGWGMTQGLLPAQLTNADTTLLRSAMLTGLLLAFVAVVDSTPRLRLVLSCLALGGAVAALVTVGSSASGVDLGGVLKPPGLVRGTSLVSDVGLSREGVQRSQGTAQHPLESGTVMAALLPVTLAGAVLSRPRSGARVLWVGTAALLVLAALSTVSRSSLVGVGIGVTVFALFVPGRVVALLIGAAVAGGVVLTLSDTGAATALITSISPSTVVSDASLTSRQIGLQHVLTEVFPYQPWLGQGLGTYLVDVQPVLDNQYLGDLAETGLVGLVARLALGAVALGTLLRLRTSAEPEVRVLAGGIAGALAALVVISAVLDVAAFTQAMTVYTLLLAAAAALALTAGGATGTPGAPAATPGRVVAGAPA